MSLYGTDSPIDRAYDYYVRITVSGIDCFSIGSETKEEAERIEAILGSSEGVEETEVIES